MRILYLILSVVVEPRPVYARVHSDVLIVAALFSIRLRQTHVPLLDLSYLFTDTPSCVRDEESSGHHTGDLEKQNDTTFVKPFLELHLSYRNLLRYPSGMMSASGLLSSLWKRHTGNSSFKTGSGQNSEFLNGRQHDYIVTKA